MVGTISWLPRGKWTPGLRDRFFDSKLGLDCTSFALEANAGESHEIIFYFTDILKRNIDRRLVPIYY